MKRTIESIRTFAAKAHEGQQRRYTPQPYIVHPEAVSNICALYTKDRCIIAAALLHDVLEDTEVTAREMSSFLHSVMDANDAKRTTGIVFELTDVYTKSRFPKWNRHTRRRKEAMRLGAASSAAQTIKYADIIDNCRCIAMHDASFAPVYLQECEHLLQHMKKGITELYTTAKDIILQERKSLRLRQMVND